MAFILDYNEYLSFRLPKKTYVIYPTRLDRTLKINNDIIQELKNSKAYLIIDESEEPNNWLFTKTRIGNLLDFIPYKNIIILSANKTYICKPNSFYKDTCPYKVFYYNYYISKAKHDIQKRKSSNVEPNKHFACLMGVDKYYRQYLFYRLSKLALLDAGYVSHNRFKPISGFAPDIYFNNLVESNENYSEISQKILKIDSFNIVYKGDWKDKIYFSPFEEFSLLDVITETSVANGSLFISEKTFKPILSKNLFLNVSSPFTLKFLKSLGFKTFSNVFDESYDEILCPVTRIDKIVKELKNFCSLPFTEALKIKKDNEDILDYNYNYLKYTLDVNFNTKSKIEKYFWNLYEGETYGRN